MYCSSGSPPVVSVIVVVEVVVGEIEADLLDFVGETEAGQLGLLVKSRLTELDSSQLALEIFGSSGQDLSQIAHRYNRLKRSLPSQFAQNIRLERSNTSR